MDFFHHICNTCLSIPEAVDGVYQKYKSCSGCKLISYCSVGHQKADWSSHKRFCTQVKKIAKAEEKDSLFSHLNEISSQSLYSYQCELVERLENLLSRPLTLSERSSIFFPDICGLCLNLNGKAYIFCDRCRVQFYCRNEHKKDHSGIHGKDCDSLKLCFENFIGLSTNRYLLPERILLKRELDSPIRFPSSLNEYFSTFLDVEGCSFFDQILFSDVLSYVMTLTYAVYECYDIIGSRSSVCVHIIGTTCIETYMLEILEHFYLWFPHIDVLELFFIGPDCPEPDMESIKNAKRKHGSRLSVAFHSGELYHDFIKTMAHKPDMIIAFNCGFHEFSGRRIDSWRPTINYIRTDMSVILVTTSYTALEAEKDSKFFVDYNERVRCIKSCEINPFRSLNPYRNPERVESCVFFNNQILSIFLIGLCEC